MTLPKKFNLLPAVVTRGLELFQDRDLIILGDLIADCKRGDTYFDEDDLSSPLRASNYTWLITNEADTNFAASECTYDRIIITQNSQEDYKNNWGVFLFDSIYNLDCEEAKRVSDHYPVWATFYVDRDTD